jgi:hypothetical protein
MEDQSWKTMWGLWAWMTRHVGGRTLYMYLGAAESSKDAAQLSGSLPVRLCCQVWLLAPCLPA